MDDALVVRGFEAVGDLPGDLERLVERNRALLDPLGQRRALDQLHDERAVLDAVDRGDVRMVEGGEHLRLAREARHAHGVPGEVFRDQLDRDLATELAVGGAIHLSHGAFAELRGDAVVGDRFGVTRAECSSPRSKGKCQRQGQRARGKGKGERQR